MARGRLEETLNAFMAQGNITMAESFSLDKPPRPPTFVQIRAPAGSHGIARKKLLSVGVGIALLAALSWAAYRLTINQVGPVVMRAVPTVTEALSPHSVLGDLNSKLAKLTIDAAVSAPVWSRQSLIDSISPFDASVPDRQVLTRAPPADPPM
jgi:hypothetical protein